MYTLSIKDGFVVFVSPDGSGQQEISQEEYNAIMLAISSKPKDPAGYTYRLRADTLEWELVELPPEPEPEPTTEDKAEAYDILIGGTP